MLFAVTGKARFLIFAFLSFSFGASSHLLLSLGSFSLRRLWIRNVLALPVSKLFPLFSADTSYSSSLKNFGHSSVYPTLLSVIKILTITGVIGACFIMWSLLQYISSQWKGTD